MSQVKAEHETVTPPYGPGPRQEDEKKPRPNENESVPQADDDDTPGSLAEQRPPDDS